MTIHNMIALMGFFSIFFYKVFLLMGLPVAFNQVLLETTDRGTRLRVGRLILLFLKRKLWNFWVCRMFKIFLKSIRISRGDLKRRKLRASRRAVFLSFWRPI